MYEKDVIILKKNNIFKLLILNFLISINLLLVFSSIWIDGQFENVAMSEIVFHLRVPLNGSNLSLVYSFIWTCLFPSIILTIVITYIIKKNIFIQFSFKYILIIFSILLPFNFYFFADKIDIPQYLSYMSQDTTLYDDYYVDPSQIEYHFPKEKQNLIYIFLESMETTYFSKELGGALDENIIPELYELQSNNTTFNQSGFTMMNGASWTIAAMVAQSAGIPLNLPIDGNSYKNDVAFLPGAYSLGDILGKAGYNQKLMIGSDAIFGGRKYYYELHGNYEIIDYEVAKQKEWITQDYRVWWGYEDSKMLEFAKREILELASQNQPFNFTMLTADTHFPDGYLCPDCPNIYESQYANVMACSSKKVAEFVKWIQEQSFYENTTIVLVGDHLSMDGKFFNQIENDYHRNGY